MKIVKNSCYGGFSVSKKVAEKLTEKGYDLGKGIKSHFKDTDGNVFCKWSFYCSNETFGIKDDNYDAYRAFPELIKAIEEVGLEDASGSFSKLVIVDIPDDIEWYIDDYDGIETIREKSLEW